MARVCVFCGSRVGAAPAYAEAAHELGSLLATRGLGLVYGGGGVGLMRTVADAALAAGGEVIGVIPHALVAREVAHPGLTDLRIVETMHERKALMAALADGFVALPGGLGTLDELMEAWTWGTLGVHTKALGLLNVEGYFDGLLTFLDGAVAAGFVAERSRSRLLVEARPADLLDRMAAFEDRDAPPWTRRPA